MWLGVWAEDQERWDEWVGELALVPAVVRFISVEPMLSEIDCGNAFDSPPDGSPYGSIGWVICGGESGGPHERRLVRPFSEDGVHTRYVPKPESLDWVRSLRDQCQAAGVPFFFKQWSNGRTLVTAAMTLKLGATFRTTPEFWLNAQKVVDLYRAAHPRHGLPEPMVQAG